MTKFILSFLLVLFIAVLFYSCSDSPTAAGEQIIKRDLVGVKKLDSQNDTLAQTSSYHKYVPIPGGSYQLLIGKLDNVEARTLIQLSLLIPDSLVSDISSGSATITGATLFFTRNNVYGDTLAPLQINAYEITSSWLSSGFTSDSLSKLTYNTNNVAESSVFSDTGLALNLNTQFIGSWFSDIINGDSSAIKGILIAPTAGSQVVGYQSLNNYGGTSPYLSVILEKPNAYTDSLIFGTYQDLSVVTGSSPNISSQDIAVQGGLALRSKLRFDLTKLPSSDIVINDAPLTLKINTAESIVGTDSISGIVAYRLTDPNTDSFDSTKSVLLSRSGNTLTGNIATYIRDWIKGSDNYGLLLISEDETGSVDRFSIYGSTATQTNRPHLTIYYTNKQ